MAVRDIKVIRSGGPVRVHDVDDRTTSTLARAIYAGEPIIAKTPASAGEFCIPVVNGGPVVGTHLFLGIPVSTSTETSTVDGTIDYKSLIGGQTVLQGKATTASNINTAAKLLALKGHMVLFDDTSSTYTIDENDSDAPNNNALKIIGGDTVKGTVNVLVNGGATDVVNLIGQTMD